MYIGSAVAPGRSLNGRNFSGTLLKTQSLNFILFNLCVSHVPLGYRTYFLPCLAFSVAKQNFIFHMVGELSRASFNYVSES